jgi:monoamine oxidase
MARTPLAQAVEDAAATFANEHHRTTRRGLLKGAGAAVAGATLLGRMATPARAAGRRNPRIAVVGAGLAGLTAAYRLQQAGYASEVYEASDRIGGRCWTGRGDFDDGQIYERGGELIDSGHDRVIALAAELGLQLDDLIAAETPGTEMLGYFNGRPYTVAQMNADFQPVLVQMAADVAAAGYPTHFDSYTPRGFELDHMSIYDYIDQYVPGGHGSQLGALLDVAYNIEYGAETKSQSSLNMLYLIGYSDPSTFTIFGASDEKYHVRGGNDQLATGLATLLGSAIRTNKELTAIRKQGTGYQLTLRSGEGDDDQDFDHVVLAIPFSIMRRSVDWSHAGFDKVKARAINEMGMGNNTKLHVQFRTRLWRDKGSNGDTYSDLGYMNTWEVTRAQSGRSGILVNYTGGSAAVAAGDGSPADQARGFLRQFDRVLRGAGSRWNGKVTRDHWPSYKWTRGAYSYWKVGQYTRFSGIEGVRSGNCHFAGEHTSVDFQGYLQGAVQTGENAAAEILADLAI